MINKTKLTIKYFIQSLLEILGILTIIIIVIGGIAKIFLWLASTPMGVTIIFTMIAITAIGVIMHGIYDMIKLTWNEAKELAKYDIENEEYNQKTEN